MEPVISRVEPQELAALRNISTETFTETFAAQNTPENLRNYLETAFSEAQLSSELSNPLCDFRFVRHAGTIAGYIKLNRASAQTEAIAFKGVEIHRIYVRRAFQGKQIGQLLLDFAVEQAHLEKADFLWLGVWEKNEKAIAFYRKNGFETFDQHAFLLGDDLQTDLLMRKQLGKR
jgi:ribosomal protein S18 acetylase RimI-like enzyme